MRTSTTKLDKQSVKAVPPTGYPWLPETANKSATTAGRSVPALVDRSPEQLIFAGFRAIHVMTPYRRVDLSTGKPRNTLCMHGDLEVCPLMGLPVDGVPL